MKVIASGLIQMPPPAMAPASSAARRSPGFAAKRAVNTGVVVSGSNVIVSHGDENLDTSTMGMIAAIDGSATGDIKTTKWNVRGTEYGFSSPVIDGQRLYQLDGAL